VVTLPFAHPISRYETFICQIVVFPEQLTPLPEIQHEEYHGIIEQEDSLNSHPFILFPAK